MTIAIGIAGFGKHALGRILPAIEANQRLRPVAVWTRNEHNQALLRERGITDVTADFTRFLKTPMDVVYVASPTGLHFEHTAAVLKAGHHAWVEKPVATRLEDVHRLTSMAQAGNRMLAEAFMFPWHAQASQIMRMLEEGVIGRLRHASFTFCFPHLTPENFRYDPALGGGAFLDHACYLTKALDVYLGGTWTVLGGCAEYAHLPVDVSGAAQLRRDEDGVIANLNWGFGSSYVNEIQFVGDRGRLQVESAFTKPATRPCHIVFEDAQGRRTPLDVRQEDPYARMLDAFVHQFASPATWHDIREDMLWHAEQYFSLYSRLKQCR